MKHRLIILAATFCLGSLISCESDFRRPAQGAFSEVLVVMDESRWNSDTAAAIRQIFGSEILTLPVTEDRYDLRFMTLETNRDLEYAKSHKNAIFAATINEETRVGSYLRAVLSDEIQESVRSEERFAVPLKDRWYKNQWTLMLSSPDDELLAGSIREKGQPLVSDLDHVEMERWMNEIYRRGEQVSLSDSLMDNHGFSIRVQHDYRIGIDTTGFVTMRRTLSDNDRWIWFWYKDGVEDQDHIDAQWVNAKRDSLQRKHFRGSRDGSYIQTEYERLVDTSEALLNGRTVLETRGTWHMTNDFMGGPFLNYAIYDEDQKRLYLMEFAQFAPRYPKRGFMNQFEAMANTFTVGPIHDDP